MSDQNKIDQFGSSSSLSCIHLVTEFSFGRDVVKDVQNMVQVCCMLYSYMEKCLLLLDQLGGYLFRNIQTHSS